MGDGRGKSEVGPRSARLHRASSIEQFAEFLDTDHLPTVYFYMRPMVLM